MKILELLLHPLIIMLAIGAFIVAVVYQVLVRMFKDDKGENHEVFK